MVSGGVRPVLDEIMLVIVRWRPVASGLASDDEFTFVEGFNGLLSPPDLQKVEESVYSSFRRGGRGISEASKCSGDEIWAHLGRPKCPECPIWHWANTSMISSDLCPECPVSVRWVSGECPELVSGGVRKGVRKGVRNVRDVR